MQSEVWAQYYMQILVHQNSQDIEAWMVKPLSAGCVSTVHREIFAVKVFLSMRESEKIKHAKINYMYLYMVTTLHERQNVKIYFFFVCENFPILMVVAC